MCGLCRFLWRHYNVVKLSRHARRKSQGNIMGVNLLKWTEWTFKCLEVGVLAPHISQNILQKFELPLLSIQYIFKILFHFTDTRWDRESSELVCYCRHSVKCQLASLIEPLVCRGGVSWELDWWLWRHHETSWRRNNCSGIKWRFV